MDAEQRLFPLMGFRMSVREGQAARAVVIRGRAIAPLTSHGTGVVEKISVIDRVRMLVDHDEK